MALKKVLVSAAVLVVGVVGVMNVAIADPPAKVTVCVQSNGNGTPNHTVTIPVHAAENGPFGGSCGASTSGGGFGGRVSAADTAEELAETR